MLFRSLDDAFRKVGAVVKSVRCEDAGRCEKERSLERAGKGTEVEGCGKSGRGRGVSEPYGEEQCQERVQ